MFNQLILLSRRRAALPVFSCLLLFFATAANAATIDWESTSGGDYHTGTNWVGNGVPGSADIARFNIANTYGVTFEETGGFSNLRLYVNSGDVTFDLDGKTLNLTDGISPHDSAQPFTISGSSGPSVTVLNGTINITTRGTIGLNGQSGALTIGSGGVIVAGDDFLAGQRGDGTLLIENGGSLTTERIFIGHRNGGSGTATVTGVGSTWAWGRGATSSAIGGSDSSGVLNVLNGGVVTGGGNDRVLQIGTGALPTSGTLLVSGTGSRLTLEGGMAVGRSDGEGFALVTVADSGRLEVDASSGIELRTSGVFTGDGAVAVAGTTGLGNSGVLRPGLLDTEGGFSGGILNIEGNYTQTATGTLNINLGGTAEGNFGVVEVSDGVAALDGILDVALVNGFEINWDQFFHVLRLGVDGSMSGQFTGLDEDALVGTFGGVNLYITYDPEAFGATSGGVGLYTAIPEPHTYALMFGALVGALALLRRRR